MKDAAFSDGIFSNIVVLRNQAPHSDRQNTDLLLHYLLSYLQRYGTASARISRMIRARPKPTPFSGLSLRSGM